MILASSSDTLSSALIPVFFEGDAGMLKFNYLKEGFSIINLTESSNQI